MLSLWEPFLEPWRCNVNWRHAKSKSESTTGIWNFEMQASDRYKRERLQPIIIYDYLME